MKQIWNKNPCVTLWKAKYFVLCFIAAKSKATHQLFFSVNTTPASILQNKKDFSSDHFFFQLSVVPLYAETMKLSK